MVLFWCFIHSICCSLHFGDFDGVLKGEACMLFCVYRMWLSREWWILEPRFCCQWRQFCLCHLLRTSRYADSVQCSPSRYRSLILHIWLLLQDDCFPLRQVHSLLLGLFCVSLHHLVLLWNVVVSGLVAMFRVYGFGSTTTRAEKRVFLLRLTPGTKSYPFLPYPNMSRFWNWGRILKITEATYCTCDCFKINSNIFVYNHN